MSSPNPASVIAPGEVVIHGDGWHLRRSTPADNDALCRVFREVHVGGALDINQEREPDFFALLRLHGVPDDHILSFIAVDDATGDTVGCSTLVLRPGWFEGEEVLTGYAGDLRVAPGFRGGKHLARAYGAAMSAIRERYGAEIFTTVIFDANKRAVKALTGGSAHRAEQPVYRPMTPFQMVSVQHTLRKPAPPARVREATDADRDELLDFLVARQRLRLLGERTTPDRLAARMASWPGFRGLEDFFLVRGPSRPGSDGRDGPIVGCLAPWNTEPVKRTRVIGYNEHMRWIRRVFDLGAALGRFPRLPPPGQCFDFSFLTHMEVVDDDPAVLHDLLLATYRRLRARGEHFVSAFVPRGSPLEGAFKGFATQTTAMTLYAVHPGDSRFASRSVATLHPGFEIALS